MNSAIRVSAGVQRFIDEHLTNGQYADADELLQAASRDRSDDEQELASVQAAVNRFKAGEQGAPLDEVIERVRHQVEGAS